MYRYIFKLGFLDGIQGFEWDFFQGLWYRMLIDAKVHEIKKKAGNDKEKIRQILKCDYGIELWFINIIVTKKLGTYNIYYFLYNEDIYCYTNIQ